MKLKRAALTVVAAVLTGAVLTGCSSEAVPEQRTSESGRPLKVVAAFGPLAEMVSFVGGPFVKVTNLTGVGIEPHDLELSGDQIDMVLDADLVVFVGSSFQPSLTKALTGRAKASTDVLKSIKTLTSEEYQIDPHFWLDPLRFGEAGASVAKELSVLDPEHAVEYQANVKQYSKTMADLNREFVTGLASCSRREIVTAHSAFGYLADRYNLEQIPVAGISPEAEPDAQRMAEIADLIVKRGVTTLFTEELVSPKVAQALAREANVKTEVLSPIEGFTPDEVSAGVAYADKMRSNLKALSGALGCS